LLSVVLLLSFLSVSCVRGDRSSEVERPNIILIVTDDQNADTITYMPNLQRLLVEGGTSFSQAFSPTPLCCPSRASILRGQYAHNHGVRSNDGINGGFPKFFDTGEESSTLATWLQEGGYRTALVGKYFNAYPESLVPPEGYRSPGEQHVPPGWDEWYGLLDIPKDLRTNPYDMYGYPMNQNGRIVRYGDDKEDYLTDVLGDLAVEFVDDAAQADDPLLPLLRPDRAAPARHPGPTPPGGIRQPRGTPPAVV
jgi:arylsulfatase A-like enzyme